VTFPRPLPLDAVVILMALGDLAFLVLRAQHAASLRPLCSG
jgi:hypothetical protein